MSEESTVVDVLETALDGDLSAARIKAMSEAEMNAFAETIAAFYRGRKTGQPEHSDEVVIFTGSRNHDGAIRRPHFGNDLNVSLLYADRVFVECVLGQQCELVTNILKAREDAFRHGVDPDEGPEEFTIQVPRNTRSILAYYVEEYRRYAKLIERGYLTLVPPSFPEESKLYERTWLGLAVGELWREWRHQDVEHGAEPMVHFDVMDGILRGRDWRARFVPTIPAQADYYFETMEKLAVQVKRDDLDARVLNGVVRARLPLLESLSPDDVLAIREAEHSFQVWRAELRQATRIIENSTGFDTFVEDSRAVLEDHLLVAADRVQETASKSRTLRSRTSAIAVDAGFSATASSLAAVLTGVDPAPAALGGIGIGAAMRIVYEGVFQHSPAQDRAVIAYLKQRVK